VAADGHHVRDPEHGTPATVPWWVPAGFAVGGVLLLLQGLLCLPVIRGPVPHAETYDSVCQIAIDTVAGLLILARAARMRRERGAWVLLGCGVLAFAAGDAYWTLMIQHADPEPESSFADVLWLTLYPCFWVGLSGLLRARLPRLGAATWLDGIIAAATAAAFAALPYLAAIGGGLDGSRWEVAAQLAYPVADIVLVGCLLGAWALTGWRTDRVWLLLFAGMALFTFGDAVATLGVFGAGFVAGAWLDLAWSAGLLVIAVAAWPGGAETARPARVRATVALPAVLTCACLALLLYGSSFHRGLPLVTGVLAALAVSAGLFRMVLTLRAVEALADARRQARTDDLTELPNRRLFLERLDGALGGRDRTAPMAVAVVDLDRFKEVNDSFGHHVGDRLLQLVAARLHGPVGARNTLARLGGDEFGLVLPDADAEAASERASRLLAALRDPFELDGATLHVDASIGIAVFPGDGTDRSTLLRHADAAMYAAKAAHSGFALSTRGLDDHATRRRLDTLEELRTGLDRDELVLHYQPQLDVASMRVVGVEALVRWDHPTRGLVYPDAFLPIAEHAGLMDRLTVRVLEIAVRQCAAWRARGLDLTVAVNVSSSNLNHPDFPTWLTDALGRHGVPAGSLQLEVTEGVLLDDLDRTCQLLATVRHLGIRLAVDDYGTGYSSLAYLHALPVDDLKLDRAFVAHCDTDRRSAAIVASTVDLAHNLGMRIVAEGVENEAVLTRLREYGCDLAQGYHLARPQHAGALTPWLHRQRALATIDRSVAAGTEWSMRAPIGGPRR
jgi:diguanylate cyclase (GGDEF)-like protein